MTLPRPMRLSARSLLVFLASLTLSSLMGCGGSAFSTPFPQSFKDVPEDAFRHRRSKEPGAAAAPLHGLVLPPPPPIAGPPPSASSRIVPTSPDLYLQPSHEALLHSSALPAAAVLRPAEAARAPPAGSPGSPVRPLTWLSSPSFPRPRTSSRCQARALALVAFPCSHRARALALVTSPCSHRARALALVTFPCSHRARTLALVTSSCSSGARLLVSRRARVPEPSVKRAAVGALLLAVLPGALPGANSQWQAAGRNSPCIAARREVSAPALVERPSRIKDCSD